VMSNALDLRTPRALGHARQHWNVPAARPSVDHVEGGINQLAAAEWAVS
jgi:hypothetical protein